VTLFSINEKHIVQDMYMVVQLQLMSCWRPKNWRSVLPNGSSWILYLFHLSPYLEAFQVNNMFTTIIEVQKAASCLWLMTLI